MEHPTDRLLREQRQRAGSDPADPWGPSIFTPSAPPPPPQGPPPGPQQPWPSPQPQPQPQLQPPPAAPTQPFGWPQPSPQPYRPPRRGPAVGVLVAVVAVVAGLLGGVVGARLGGGGQAGSTKAPVINQVAASNASSVDKVQAVAQNLLPVTVQIQVGTGLGGATGSGVIMTADGYILTNNHVIEGANSITVVLPTSEAVRARLVGADPSNDLAVVKVDKRDLPVATFGRSSELKVGELTVAVGSPFGLSGSVTSGIISALHRVVQVSQSEQLVNAIQTDASINPGNSGGALANGSGQVIGINTAIATEGGNEANAGVGFAIPIDEALQVARSLIEGKPIQTPLLGVRGGTDLTPEVAEQYHLKGRTGALIRDVDAGGAADKAGMRAGDLVVKINGEAVAGWDQLVVAVRKVHVGQTVPVVVVRDGKEITLQVTPTLKRPP